MYRGTLTSSGSNLCPTNIKNYNASSMNYVYGMTAHPTNPNELYVMARNQNRIYKITVNSAGTGHTVNWQKGSYGNNKK